MSSPLLHALDTNLEHLARVVARTRLRDPLRRKLAPHLRDARNTVLTESLPEARRLAAGVLRHEPEAIAAYDELVAKALAKMRAYRPKGDGWLMAIDRMLYANRPELLDDPAFPKDQRVHVLDRLDKLNDILGSYDTFVELTMPFVERARRNGTKKVAVHDLASGHGGFALVLKERLGDAVEVTASDIKDEYLELGRAAAKERGLDVRFVLQDALSLGNLAEEQIDVFTCTQTLHHFEPGMIARMIGEAARVSRTGLVFVDAERSLMAIAALGPFALLYGRSYAFVHDTVTSLRRMLYEEELALLAGLAPGLPENARVETGFAFPGHAYLRIATSAE